MESRDEIYSEFFKAAYGRTPNNKELTDFENTVSSNFGKTLFDSSWEVKMRESNNIRTKIADFVKKASPTPPSLGLPLPEVLNVRWPAKLSQTLLNIQEATATDVKIKDLIIKKIKGS